MRPLARLLGILAPALLVTPLAPGAQRLTVAPPLTVVQRDLAPVRAHLQGSIAAVRERAGDYRIEGNAITVGLVGVLGRLTPKYR